MNNIVKASLAALSIGQAVSLNAQKPNFVIMMTDQQRADLTEREGYPLDSLRSQTGWGRREHGSVMPIHLARQVPRQGFQC